MNGPEHYTEAEHLLAASAQTDAEVAMWQVAQAQVHATLALAAAVLTAAEVIAGPARGQSEYRAATVRPWHVAQP